MNQHREETVEKDTIKMVTRLLAQMTAIGGLFVVLTSGCTGVENPSASTTPTSASATEAKSGPLVATKTAPDGTLLPYAGANYLPPKDANSLPTDDQTTEQIKEIISTTTGSREAMKKIYEALGTPYDIVTFEGSAYSLLYFVNVDGKVGTLGVTFSISEETQIVFGVNGPQP